MIREYLEQMVKGLESIGHPAIMERFVLRNGKEFVAQPFTGLRATPKECFSNATHLHVGTYVEGYTMRRDLPLAFHHAWRVENGKVIDNTLQRPEECEYMGVEIEFRELMRELDRNRVYGILDTGMVNFEFMFKRDPELKTIAEKIIGREITMKRKRSKRAS